MLSGNQTKPCCKVSALPKVLGRGAEGLNGHGGHWTDTWHGLQPTRFSVLQCTFLDFDIQCGDFNINGKIERMIREIKDLIRTFGAGLQEKIGSVVALGSLVTPAM